MDNGESRDFLQNLMQAPKLRSESLSQASREQGVYVFWVDDRPPLCLKVGIAGPRKGYGLFGRLSLHFSSNLANSVLARHLAADFDAVWARPHDFRDRAARKLFFATRCYCQAIRLPGFTRDDLLDFEKFLIDRLQPKYVGTVKHDRA